MDCTHSLQQPNQSSGITGGKPELISTIAKAAIAVGADGLFIETHPDPANAKSDGANMLHLDLLEETLTKTNPHQTSDSVNMSTSKVFLTAEWRKLALAQYAVDKEILSKYLPPHTELDDWQGKYYVSLVGFMFVDVKTAWIQYSLSHNF